MRERKQQKITTKRVTGSIQPKFIITNQMKNVGIATTLEGISSMKHGGMVKHVSRRYYCALKFFHD